MAEKKIYFNDEDSFRMYVEAIFFELEGFQFSARPFIWWTDEAVIYDMWIPFSKLTFIGKNSYKTYSKQEIRALLSSSFQKYGKFWPYLRYLPFFILLILPFVCISFSAVVFFFLMNPELSKLLIARRELPFIFSMVFILLFSPFLVPSFYMKALITNVPQISADNRAIALHDCTETLLSALRATKKYPVYAGFFLADVLNDNKDLFIALIFPHELLNPLAQRIFFFSILTMIVYWMLEGREYKVCSSFNVSNSIDARIKNLEKKIENKFDK